ncbi:MAG: hypothetical protein FJ255_10785 [Phycisphaerae bacterium]|nr:hypothetical protein [Phycisphaerae bacterium]
MVQPLRNLLIVLGVVGFLLQALAVGGGAGQAMCVGCERGWWTISPPCAPEQGVDCCDKGEDDGTTPAHSDHSQGRSNDDCGCIDIPLPHGTPLAAAAPRIEQGSGWDTPVAIAVLWQRRTRDVFPIRTTWARAGPESAPRLLTPLARFTVLVI